MVDFEENRIHICKHFITDSTGTRIEEGCKTTAGDRWLYMDDETMDMLKEYRAYCDRTAKKFGTNRGCCPRPIIWISTTGSGRATLPGQR